MELPFSRITKFRWFRRKRSIAMHIPARLALFCPDYLTGYEPEMPAPMIATVDWV
jgi:hypothetical protein